MKNLGLRTLSAAVVLAGMAASAKPSADSVTTFPEVQREFRGVWVATVANIDWPSSAARSSVEQQKAELIAILEKAKALNLNGIVLQVRPACDALYASKLEPWSPYLTGTMGKAPEPYYDPLAFAVDECHKRGLELHAWFNPYRALHPSYKGPISEDHVSKTKPQLVKKYGSYLWLNPADKEVQDHTYAVVMDVVKRYDIDGVHMDDYFYPYPEKDKATGKELDFPDEETYQAYRRSGGKLDRADWRRQAVNSLMERLYKGIKQDKPWVKFGLSPFGIWKPGYPPQVKGFSQYDKLYADARLWLEKGWVDYWTPQLYWRIAAPEQSFVALLTWWSEQNKMKRHIWPGLFTSKVGDKSKTSWTSEEIINQIKWTRILVKPSGQVHFSMSVFMENRLGINDELTTSGIYDKPALVPAMPWLDAKVPAKPSLEVTREDQKLLAAWKPKDPNDVRVWVVHAKTGSKWSTEILPAQVESKVFAPDKDGALPEIVAVSAVDRCGNESARATWLASAGVHAK
ncbi:MAG: glycoside hydrolase family 10 protein [Candidatus Sumerlaeaceae bacterium]